MLIVANDEVAANKRTLLEARVPGTQSSSSDSSSGSIWSNSSDDMESKSSSTALQLRWLELQVMSKKNSVTLFLQTRQRPQNRMNTGLNFK